MIWANASKNCDASRSWPNCWRGRIWTCAHFWRRSLPHLPPASPGQTCCGRLFRRIGAIFGDEMPTPAPLKQLSAEVVVDRVAVGRICVWYPDVATEAHFLREEVNLLNTVAQHLAEAVQRNRAAERVQRLSYLYETMVLTN